MLRPLFVPLAVLLGCAPGPRPRGGCKVEDNALRPVCRFEASEPVQATLTYGVKDEPPRTLMGSGRRLVFTLWDLPPKTRVHWELEWRDAEGTSRSRTGRTRTDSLPRGLQVTILDIEPGDDAIDRLLISAACPVPSVGGGTTRRGRELVVTDRLGVVRWYQGPPSGGEVRAFDASEDGTMWLLADRRALHEIALDGTTLLSLEQPEDYPFVGHHDLTSRNGQTLLLHARTEFIGQSYWIVDGLTEISPDGTAEPVFTFSDIVAPRLTGTELKQYWNFSVLSGVDFGHANSIDVDPDGRWLISFKHLDSVFAIDGDPDSPTRGEKLFSIVGGFRGLDDGDYRVVGPDGTSREGFEFPHHARWLGDNRLSLFDNGRRPPGDDERNGDEEPPRSRALVLELDDEERTARIVSSYELDRFCPIQSSAYTLSDGSMLVFCSADSRFWVFDPAGVAKRQAQVRCENDAVSARFPRVIPLDWDYRPIPP